MFSQQERELSATLIPRMMRAVTGDDTLTLHALRHSAAHRALWQLRIAAGLIPNAIREQYFNEPCYTGSGIAAAWPGIDSSDRLGLARRYPWLVAARMGHGEPLTTHRHYLHVPDALAWMDAVNQRYRLPKQALIPLMGNNTWSYSALKRLEAPSPKQSTMTVDATTPATRENTAMTIDASALWTWLRGKRQNRHRQRRQQPRPPHPKGAERMDDAPPFPVFLERIQRVLLGIDEAQDSLGLHLATLQYTERRVRMLTETPWAPFEVAHWRWRQELADWLSPRALDAYALPAVDAALAVFDGTRFVARHQRTLKRVHRVLAYWAVPARHIHVTVRVPKRWDDGQLDTFSKGLLSRSGRGVAAQNLTIERSDCRTPVYQVTTDDPRSPISGFITGLVWFAFWLRLKEHQ